MLHYGTQWLQTRKQMITKAKQVMTKAQQVMKMVKKVQSWAKAADGCYVVTSDLKATTTIPLPAWHCRHHFRLTAQRFTRGQIMWFYRMMGVSALWQTVSVWRMYSDDPMMLVVNNIGSSIENKYPVDIGLSLTFLTTGMYWCRTYTYIIDTVFF